MRILRHVCFLLVLFQGLLAHAVDCRFLLKAQRDFRLNPAHDSYWSEWDRLKPEKGNDYRGRYQSTDRKVWFAPSGNIGNQTIDFIDIAALDLWSVGYTKYRVDKLIVAPWRDSKEIEHRQKAIQELTENPKMFESFKAEYLKESSKDWMERFFSSERGHYEEPERIQVFYQTPGEEDVMKRAVDSRNFQVREIDRWNEEMVQRRRQFFIDVRKFHEILNSSPLKSDRLKQMNHLIGILLSDRGSKGTGNWIDLLIDSPGLKEHEILMFNLLEDSHLKKRLELLVETVSELVMYFELANLALLRNWKTFPQILDPEQTHKPVLTIVNGHAPRVLYDQKRQEGPESVGNTVTLGNGKNHLIIVGPNAQGKSTTIRMTAQLVALAQLGMPVPADAMSLTPLELIIHLHPKDDPEEQQSLFMAEMNELYNGVFRRAARNPFQLVIMDEIAPGTMFQIREDIETIFLEELDKVGVLSMTATHNIGTTRLANAPGSRFDAQHVADYRLLPGAEVNPQVMYQGAADAAKKVGVPEAWTQKLIERGKARAAK